MTKISIQSLNAELDNRQWPQFNALDQSNRCCAQFDFLVPTDLSYFTGHFPEQAVLPGVVQVHWAGELASKVFGVSAFRSLKSLKFNNMILPGDEIRLDLEFNAQRATVKFAYSKLTEKTSSGVIGFAV